MSALPFFDTDQMLADLAQHNAAQNYGQQPAELYAPISYLMDMGGKRMRPLLVLMGHATFGGDYRQILAPALGVEVFHNFTLMHDDIMDQAPLRRGLPTVHHKWNQNVAILSGDVMLVQAYKLLMQVPDGHLRPVLERFNQCAAQVCEGQQWDMNFEQRSDVGVDDYVEMIKLKTAVLLGFALELGALLAGADAEACQHLRDFGIKIGIAFQLKDDYLDVYAEPDKFGKQVGGDILANKKTLLLISALELATGNVKADLDYWLSADNPNPEEKVAAVRRIYDQLELPSYTFSRIDAFYQQALHQLHQLQAPEPAKAAFEAFAQQLMSRDK
jgi:geranylgeranyl diphosphate synthase, type II